MAEVKPAPNDASPAAFIASLENEGRRKDCKVLLSLMKQVTGEAARMWGDSIVGFGSYHYRYDSGREGDWFLTGFSPRKQYLTIYVMPGFARFETTMRKLGTYKLGKSCLYIKTLDDIDRDALRELIERSVRRMHQKYT